MISEVFGPDLFSGLSKVFPAAHKLQMLLILLANKTFNAKSEILAANAVLGTKVLETSADVAVFTNAILSASTLDNIIKFEPPFQPHQPLVHQSLKCLQSGQTISKLPLHVLSEVERLLQGFQDDLKKVSIVNPSAILLRLAPYFPNPSSESTSSTPSLHSALMARELPVSSISADSSLSASDTVVQFGPAEVAFVARQDLRKDSRQDSRQDLRKDSRQDYRRPTPSWDRRSDSQERSRLDRPSSASGTMRMDDDDRHELLHIQQHLQSLVSKVSGKTSLHSAFLTELSSDRPPPEAVFHAHVASSDSDADADYRY